MQPTWATADGSVKLFLGDSRDIMPTFCDRQFDACVTDPEYGIGAVKAINDRAGKQHGNAWAPSKNYGTLEWDHEPCSPNLIAHCRRVSKWQVIFGGNYFDLPPARCILVWDKLNGDNDYADCELAWTNLDKPVRRIQFRWHGMLRDEEGERVHPTQKPVRVMQWAIAHCPDNATVVDPFAGSFTTAVACIRAGHQFVGIEREPDYFAAGVARIEAELSRNVLFEPQPAIVQKTLLEGA